MNFTSVLLGSQKIHVITFFNGLFSFEKKKYLQLRAPSLFANLSASSSIGADGALMKPGV